MEYRELLLLRAARETGVLDALVSNAYTVDEVAREAGVTERAARITVDALLDMGLLEAVEEGVEPTNRMLGFVTKTDVRSIGRLPHALDTVEALVDLPETMESGEVPERPSNWTRNRLGARAAEDDASVRAAVTAAVREHPDAGDVLVVAGGPGRHAVEFARRGFDVTLLDDPDVVDAVEPLLERERVDLVAGDPLAGADGEFDVVFHAGVAREYGPDDNRRLLAAASDATSADGLAIHVDAFRDETVDAAVAAELLATTERGACYEEGAVGEWFADAGFADVRAGDVPGTEYRFVAGRRRATQ
ncbi:class I SAM-dependent methyltransferase [Halobacterium hubeiense]|uniref:class I SAM-dependent methyltransferase n=1 Tax=Halobacterium hubeiense TaxID=1407499 RepID=UPI003C77D136